MNLQDKKKAQKILNQYNRSFNKYLRNVTTLLLDIKRRRKTNFQSVIERAEENSHKALAFYDLMLEEGRTPELEQLRGKIARELAEVQIAMKSSKADDIEKEANDIALLFTKSLQLWELLLGIKTARRTTFLEIHESWIFRLKHFLSNFLPQR